MFRKGRPAGIVAGFSIVLAVMGAAAALAASSGSFTPKLGAPNGKRVHAGAVTLMVKAPSGKTVFVWLRPNKVLKRGELKQCSQTSKGCVVSTMKPWKHHPGWFKYTAPVYSFAGWWSTTPGEYYWQAQSFAHSPPCQFGRDGDCAFYSKIGRFSVTR